MPQILPITPLFTQQLRFQLSVVWGKSKGPLFFIDLYKSDSHFIKQGVSGVTHLILHLRKTNSTDVMDVE